MALKYNPAYQKHERNRTMIVNNLSEAKIGQVYNFEYQQPVSGDTTRHLARVVSVKKLTKQDIARLDAQSRYREWDSDFHRTETIVTCEMPNGPFRNFYAERTASCRRNALGKVIFALGLARRIWG